MHKIFRPSFIHYILCINNPPSAIIWISDQSAHCFPNEITKKCLKWRPHLSSISLLIFYTTCRSNLEKTHVPHLHGRHQQWHKLSKSSFWNDMLPSAKEISLEIFKSIKKQILQHGLDPQKQHKHSKLLSCCRLMASLDPILWLSMSRTGRIRCIKKTPWMTSWWQIRGLPPPFDSDNHVKKLAIHCLHKHSWPQMPNTIEVPLSFLLNPLSTKIPLSNSASTPRMLCGSILHSILLEISCLCCH